MIVVEVSVADSKVTFPRVVELDAKVERVGIGAPSLIGRTLKIQHEFGSGSTRPVYQARESTHFKVGDRIVVAIMPPGDDHRLWMMDAWAGQKNRSLDDGRRLLSELEGVNASKDLRELTDRIVFALEGGKADSRFVWERLCDCSALQQHDSLFQRIADSTKVDNRWREFARAKVKASKPDWYFSDERRDELVMLVETTTEKSALVQASKDLANAIGSIKPKIGAKWSQSLQKVALDAEDRPLEEALAIVEGVKSAINPNYRPPVGDDAPMVLWSALFQMAAASKKAAVRRAWEDAIIERTAQGTIHLKENVLSRLDEVKDVRFRVQLREAIYTPSPRFGKAPKKPD